ncbi:MAG: RDD family protein [Gammaproteobacteria bacterium]
MATTENPHAAPRPAGLGRRLAAMVYDGLVLFAVLVLASAIALALNGGHAVPAGNPVNQAWLFFVTYFFFGWFWTHGGQTVGMRAWRIRVQRPNGGLISWTQALLRFTPVLLLAVAMFVPTKVFKIALVCWAALVVLDYLWVLIDKNGLSWHDRYAKTVVVAIEPSGPEPHQEEA